MFVVECQGGMFVVIVKRCEFCEKHHKSVTFYLNRRSIMQILKYQIAMNRKSILKAAVIGVVLVVAGGLLTLNAGERKDYKSMSNEEILQLPVSELAELSLDELMAISDKFRYAE